MHVLFITSSLGMIEISQKDITTVVKLLAPADHQNLFDALGIPNRDVQKAEAGASTSDVDQKAKAVLRQWKQKKGRAATRQAILGALHECENLEAEENLEEKWTEKGI